MKTVESLPDHHYRAFVTYAPLAGKTELEQKFSSGGVSSLFDGRPWKLHHSCLEMDVSPGERIFRIAEVPATFIGKQISQSLEAVADHFDGYRFAVEIEAVEFADAHPEPQRKNGILALGASSTFRGSDDRFVAMLYTTALGRALDYCSVDLGFYSSFRLLLVRKMS